LPDQIDLARAALGEEPIYRRRGIKDLVVPRADVEVDVDMENVEAGVYLWGALVTDRSSGSPESGYHPFVCWDSLTPQAEADNSARFWRWLTALRSNTSDAGQSFRAYCYNASAENTYLRKLGLSSGILPEVTEFIDSEEWVDMLVVIDTQLITGRGSGLKRIAPIAGFAWEVDDPGGGESMLYHDTATGLGDAADCDAARRWLLTYNEGDVQATFVLRNWLDGAARDIPSIESLDPHPYT
jgi:predicted RecB family nuclease